jgi:hypothetical protein
VAEEGIAHARHAVGNQAKQVAHHQPQVGEGPLGMTSPSTGKLETAKLDVLAELAL